ncbi:MAG TPA: c-type cytochrome [Bacteroidota bacterium]
MKRIDTAAIIVFILFGILIVPAQDRPQQRREVRFNPQQDSVRFARMNGEINEKLEALRKSIGGQEDKPAPEVFKNIQVFKELKAGQIPGMMETWSRSLGTSCQHCHIVDQWQKDDKPEKQIGRDMLQMLGEINSKQLANIRNLDSKEPTISCWTCHQGRIKPPKAPWERQFRQEGKF